MACSQELCRGRAWLANTPSELQIRLIRFPDLPSPELLPAPPFRLELPPPAAVAQLVERQLPKLNVERISSAAPLSLVAQRD